MYKARKRGDVAFLAMSISAVYIKATMGGQVTKRGYLETKDLVKQDLIQCLVRSLRVMLRQWSTHSILGAKEQRNSEMRQTLETSSSVGHILLFPGSSVSATVKLEPLQIIFLAVTANTNNIAFN